jgi:hypothetical protein
MVLHNEQIEPRPNALLTDARMILVRSSQESDVLEAANEISIEGLR